MSNDKKPSNEGYTPQKKNNGYQPGGPAQQPGDPKPQSGYVPTGGGENPTNKPTPPGDE